MDRRTALLGALGFVGIVSAQAQAQTGGDIQVLGDLPPLPDDLKDFAVEPPAPYTELAGVGTGKPKPDEIDKAYEILSSAPFNTSPQDVIEYFLNLPGDLAPYRREWPVRANPVIYHFFSATDTKPEGDVTAWCAASMNWFILRSRAKSKDDIGKAPGSFSRSGKAFSPDDIMKYSTHSAASGSFRCWDKTAKPKKGDLLVLANKGTSGLTEYCRGQGHITMFEKMLKKDWAQVIGGNQTSSIPGSNGAVTRAKVFIGSGSRFLKFVTLKS